MRRRAAAVTAAGRQEWLARGERGHAAVIGAMAWLALRLGRAPARLLLPPICLYFLIFSMAARTASRSYLGRVLGRRPRLADLFRHYHTFAACLLDRLFLLDGRTELFDLRISGEEVAREALADGGGCILLGAHLGSFEAVRALGRRQPGLSVALAMYEDNARKINAVLQTVNVALGLDIVALGRPEAMLDLAERLGRGQVVGILADRSLAGRNAAGEAVLRCSFLGAPAAFPLGPFRIAAILRRPVLLMVGLYRGGGRYDIIFERLADGASLPRVGRAAAIETALRDYVGRLEHYCRLAPYNWFNFYDFWH